MKHLKYRADIDGLRAIAIISVIGFHYFPRFFKSGFVGVDIFFVISGFLISTIIFSSLEKNNFSFIEFYSRRIRRIFPALLTVLIFSLILGRFVLLSDEFMQLGKHAAGGAAFISNFILIKESGYFDSASEAKPLLHLWSLGIEEQFYIFYPILLWLGWRLRFNLLKITIFIAIISFAINLKIFKSNPIVDFYSPQTRFWELMVGSIISYISLHNSFNLKLFTIKIDNLSKNILSYIGILLIIASIFLIKEKELFPGIWAILPTLGTALVIINSQSIINRFILSQKFLTWIGTISFPLYLWHWSFLSFAIIMEGGTPNSKIRGILLVVSFLLAYLTNKFIEKPLRFGKYLKEKTIFLLILMGVIGILSIVIYTKYHNCETKNYNIYKQFSWPENLNNNCFNIPKFAEFSSSSSSYCMIKDASKEPEIVLIGDSNANHFYYGLEKLINKKNILNVGRGNCLPYKDIEVGHSKENTFGCKDITNSIINYVLLNDAIKTVIISSTGSGYIGPISELYINGYLDENKKFILKEKMKETIKLLTEAKKNVIFILSVPRLSFNPQECFDFRPFRITKKKLISPCAIKKSEIDKMETEYRSIVFDVLKEFPEVKIFDTSDVLCDNDFCYIQRGDMVFYRDECHLSLQGSEYFGKKLVSIFNLD